MEIRLIPGRCAGRAAGVALAVILGIAPVFAVEAVQEPEAVALLKKAAAYLGGLESCGVEFVTEMQSEMNGTHSETSSRYRFTVERPNRMELRMLGGVVGGSMVSDGKIMRTVIPLMEKFMDAPAPADLKGIFSGPEAAVVGSGFPLTVEGLVLRPNVALAHHFPGITIAEVKMTGMETIEGKECRRVTIRQKGMMQEFSIETGVHPWIRRQRDEMDSHFIQVGAARLPAGDTVIKMRRTINFSGWRTGNNSTPAEFKLPEPGLAKQVVSLFPSVLEEVHSMAGQQAPPLVLPSLEGREVSPIVGGQVTVLYVWTSWNLPGTRALPDVAEVAGSFGTRGVAFYTVNERDTAEVIRTWMDDRKLKVPVLLDKDGAMERSFRLKGVPQTVVINRAGKIMLVIGGFEPDLRVRLIRAIEESLQENDRPEGAR